jgi:hypothetical protein
VRKWELLTADAATRTRRERWAPLATMRNGCPSDNAPVYNDHTRHGNIPRRQRATTTPDPGEHPSQMKTCEGDPPRDWRKLRSDGEGADPCASRRETRYSEKTGGLFHACVQFALAQRVP